MTVRRPSMINAWIVVLRAAATSSACDMMSWGRSRVVIMETNVQVAEGLVNACHLLPA